MANDTWVRNVLTNIVNVLAPLVADVDVAQGTATAFVILLESGDILLLEGGDFILQEVVNG